MGSRVVLLMVVLWALVLGWPVVEWCQQSDIWPLIKNRDVLLLTVCYTCMNYVFYLIANWCFPYLVQQRHFTLLESGWVASAPPLAAAISSGVGGALGSVFGLAYGVRAGLRIVPLVSLPAAALLQFVAVDASSAYVHPSGSTTLRFASREVDSSRAPAASLGFVASSWQRRRVSCTTLGS